MYGRIRIFANLMIICLIVMLMLCVMAIFIANQQIVLYLTVGIKLNKSSYFS